MRILIYSISLLILTNSLLAQVIILDKEYADIKISYTLETKLNFIIESHDNKNSIIFPGYMDESKPGDLILPSFDIFLAIPPNTSPKIEFSILKDSQLNASPKINPKVERLNDEIIYTKPNLKLNERKKILENRGTLWIDNNYCIHLKINPLHINSPNHLSHVEQLKVTLLFDSSILINSQMKSGKISEAILDKDLAMQFYGKQDYSIPDTYTWIDFTKNYLKIGTSRDGIYRISGNDLLTNGINISSINPKTFKMYLRGDEVPIYVEGESDLMFSEDEYIEFAGLRNMGGKHHEVNLANEPYNEYLGRYTDTTVYWLSWDGKEGNRVYVSDGETSLDRDTLHYYNQIDHYEINRWYDFATPNQIEREKPFWSSNKTWHEGNINVGISNKSFTVSDIYPNEIVKLSIKLQDFASNIASKSHLFSLSLNSANNWSDSIYIDKYEIAVISTQQNSDFLLNGSNTLRINSIQTEASINSCIFDWYEIEYPRYLIPIDNSLNFSFPFLGDTDIKFVAIQKVKSENYSLWKIGENFKKIESSLVGESLIFADTISSFNKYFYSSEGEILTPKIYYHKQFKDLRSETLKADYLAISHESFEAKVEEYSQFISDEYNVDVKTVYVDDIYDEFSFGFFNPEAIKEFLKATHHFWQSPHPQYVVLLGGATYDYYSNKYHNINSVTEKVINYVPSYGGPVSDNWFVSWDSTGAYIPQMNIGRIPVTTNNQLEWYLQKHRNYLAQNFSDWNKRYLFFSSGDSKNQSEIKILHDANKFVIDNYVNTKPIGGVSSHFYKTIDPQSNFGPITEKEFQSVIDKGAVFISYLGHSGTQIWDNSITSPVQLQNSRNKYPIVSDFGCSTGKFAESDITSFSELFTVDEEGQAIAYVGNSSLGFLSTAALMPKLFYQKILDEKYFNVSQALNEAKIEMLKNYGTSGVYELFALTNSLVGDPIVSLPIPELPNYKISSSGIVLDQEIITDLQDSVVLKIYYNNLGTAIEDSTNILITHTFNGTKKIFNFDLPTPKFIDSLLFMVPIKNKPGKHILEIELDSEQNIEELYEDDNSIQYSFNVASSLIRPIFDYQELNGISKSISFLNPSSEPISNKIILDIAENPSFNLFETFEFELDSLITNFDIVGLLENKRYWGRSKIEGDANYSPPFSFIHSANKYFISDSLSFSRLQINNVIRNTNNLVLDSLGTKFEIFSAGFDDGQAAIISRNGVNYVPTQQVGHHLALFNSQPPFEFISYHYFNTYAGGQNTLNYIEMLDTLSNKFFVAIAISDEGSPKSDALKSQIKSLGSQFIDDVGFRSSWAIIGQKGAAIGSVPEVFSLAGTGSVKLDTSFTYLSNGGNVLTSVIGNSVQWTKISTTEILPQNSSINYFPIMLDDNSVPLDTLEKLSFVDGTASLSHIDAKKYPFIKILAEFEAGDNNTSPELYSLGIDYDGVPELATNYQVVSLEKDTLNQGENANLSFYVYNVGESSADSFKVRVDIINPDNSREMILDEFIESINSESKKKFDISYNTTSFNGSRIFSISIDYEDTILELYEDNNFYNIPFYVIGDTTRPSLNLTFNGNDIFDGEYISNNPEIRVELTDPSLVPITDTASVSLFLNNRYVNYLGNEENVTINFSESNPKAVVNYSPKLENGEYTLRVFGKDGSGNISDSVGISKSFSVQSEAKLLNVYNYPNPITSDTYFTFKLTQIPDEIKIKVFTVAGRLIRELIIGSSRLNFDLNKVYWDTRDNDGDLIGNGVYLYKVIMEVDGKKQDITQKLAVVR